jgi:ribose 1,5-bisphosphokinase
VTGTPTITGRRPGAIGPGRLVLVVGPSGAGKDTLLRIAHAACADRREIVFAQRVVTRPPSLSEDNRYLDRDDFQQARARGDFAVDWQAHGHCYALPRAIEEHIRAGRTVVANVSRTVIETMRQYYAEVTVVSVTAPPAVLAARLASRARSSDGQIAQRLGRAVESAAAAPDVIIQNTGSADHHARELLQIITGD